MAARHPLCARVTAAVAIAALVVAIAATDAGATVRTQVHLPRPVSSFAARFAGNPQPIGSRARGRGDFSFPDPAGVLIRRGVAQLYATGGRGGIVTKTWQLGGWGVSGATDALSKVPPPRDAIGTWAPCNDWAPTVAKLDGRYVMWFSAQIARVGGSDCDAHLRAPAHCLVYATSASPKGGFRVQGKLCVEEFATASKNHGAAISSQGLFDPTLFKDPVDKRVYLVWSQETFAHADSNCAPGHDPAPSMLVGMAVSAQGLLNYNGRALHDRIVLTSSDAREALHGADGYSFGSDCEIENPQLVLDPADATSGAPGYLLVASLGTWDEAQAYHSFAVVCSSPLGGCKQTRSSSVILDTYLDHSGRLENMGGLSVVSGTRTGPVYVLFAATRSGYGPRSCYWESATFVS
jgi:hypothetical protein